MNLRRVVSGGQTGVDRAALDTALVFGLEVAGWAPADRWAEDGRVPSFYHLVPVSEPEREESLEARTLANVRDSDATLVINTGSASPGTELTLRAAREHGTPLREIRVALPMGVDDTRAAGEEIAAWIAETPGAVLNVAGPRESEAALYWPVRECLHHALSLLRARGHLRARDPGDAETARHLRAEFVEVFRHWDTIRWQGPAWLSGIVTVGISLMASREPRGWPEVIASPLFAGLACVLMAFGAVCVLLQSNLIAYHRRLQAELRSRLHALQLPDEARSVLPFSFEGRRFWSTASAWLLLYTNLLCMALGATTAYSLSRMVPFGPRHLPAVLGTLAVELPIALLIWSLARARRRSITAPFRSAL